MTNQGVEKVVSLSEHRLPALRREISSLREKLHEVTEMFSDNDDSFKIVADIALTLQGCETIEELDHAIGVSMVEKSADHACLFLENPAEKFIAVNHVCSLDSLNEDLRYRLRQLTSTTCESCRSESYSELTGVNVTEPGSVSMIPVDYKDLRGVLVIGAEDPDYYTQEVGTLYLDFLGATLARSAERILVGS